MASDNLWMPLCVADYLADTTRLTTLQHGAYLLLLMDYWRNGPLPDDPKQLTMIARTDSKTWVRDIWPVVAGFFRVGGDGRLHQKRADAELARAQDKSTKRRAAAQSRWRGNGHDDPPPTDDASAYANASPNAHASGHAKTKQTPSKNDAKGMHSRVRATHHTTPERKEGGAHAPLVRVREAPKNRWELLPEQWEPQAKSRLLAATLGFDEPRFLAVLNHFRAHVADKKITSRDWEERFCQWLTREKNLERQRKPEAVTDQIRRDWNLPPSLLTPKFDDDAPEAVPMLRIVEGGRA